jgi:hypothetical protein
MSDQYVRMQYADDGQPNFSNWEEMPIGEVGEYGLRIPFTRLGSFYQRVIRIQCSSPRRRDVLGAVVVLQPTNG